MAASRIARQADAEHSRRNARSWMWSVIAVAAFLAISPIPLGSNRPIFWTTNAILLGVMGLIMLVVHRRQPWPLTAPPRWAHWFLAMYTTVCAYLLLQTVPFPWFGTISAAPGASWLMLLRWVSYGILTLITLNLAKSRAATALMLDAMVAIMALHAIGALYMLRAGDTILSLPKWAYLGSATGTFVSRNSLATFLALGCVLSAALLAEAIPRVVRKTGSIARVAILSLAFVVMAGTLLATHSRAGFAVAILGVLIVGVCNARHLFRLSKRVATAIAVAIPITLISLIAIGGRGLIERMAMTEDSWNIRSALYEQVWRLIAMRPLTGFGGGSFEMVFPLVHESPVGPDRVWDKSHSTYLALWSELGLIFGTLPLVMAGLILWRCSRLFILGRGHQPALVAAIATVILVAAHSLIDFSLEIQAIAFWSLAIVCLGLGEDFRPRVRSGGQEMSGSVGQ